MNHQSARRIVASSSRHSYSYSYSVQRHSYSHSKGSWWQSQHLIMNASTFIDCRSLVFEAKFRLVDAPSAGAPESVGESLDPGFPQIRGGQQIFSIDPLKYFERAGWSSLGMRMNSWTWAESQRATNKLAETAIRRRSEVWLGHQPWVRWLPVPQRSRLTWTKRCTSSRPQRDCKWRIFSVDQVQCPIQSAASEPNARGRSKPSRHRLDCHPLSD